MGGVSLSIEIKDHGVQDLLARIQHRVKDLTPAMRIIGEIVRTSIVRNFEVGGRPQKWKPLSPVTLAKRKGKKVLMIQGLAGGLAGSIHWSAHPDRAVIGTDKAYAAVHQFGAKKGSFGTVDAEIRAHIRKLKSGKSVNVRAHTRRMKLPWGDIPARPFMMVQPEDWQEIKEALAEYVSG